MKYKWFRNKQEPGRTLLDIALGSAVLVSTFLLDGNLCIYKRVLGIPCPGCGMTRAYIALFHRDIHTALHYHPLFILPPILVLLFLLRHFSRIGNIYRSNTFWLMVLTVVLAVYTYRMVSWFPDTAPMDYNPKGILPSILRAINKGSVTS